jgi:ppGpp synthetase/RelA/SpoT-type nucleotidyltranferase
MSGANNRAANKEDILVWYRDQIDKYVQVYPRYKLFALTLQKVLEKAAKRLAPEGVVQTRPKAVSSFAEKIIRKSAAGNDPVNEFTDLCGARVVTLIPAEVRAVSEFIKKAPIGAI